MRTQTNTVEKNTFKLSISLLTMFALFTGQILFIGAQNAQAQRNRDNSDKQQKVRVQKQKVDRAKSQVRSNASRFDRSLSQVNSLSRSSISTKKDIDKVVLTLRQNRASLNKGYYSKMVNMAVNDSTFKGAIEAKAKQIGYDKFAKQIQSNPSSIMQITGAKNLQSKMQNDVRQQANNLKALANKLKAAKAKFESEAKTQKKTRQISFKPISFNNNFAVNYASYNPSSFFNTYDEMNSTMYRIPVAIEAALISAAVIIIGAAAAAAVVLIQAWAQEKRQDFTEEDKDSGKTQFRECTDESDGDYDACLDGINTYISPNANFWQRKIREAEIAAAQAACTAVYSLRMADCLLLPQ